MATSTITQTRPSVRPQRRRKPDPQAVYQSYLYEARERGQRYAAKATADRYGISDDTVRRIIARHEAAERAKEEQEAAGLAYVPPPFADELAAKQPQIALKLTERDAAPDARDELAERLIMSSANVDAAVEPQAASPHRRTAELAEQPQTDDDSPQDPNAPEVPHGPEAEPVIQPPAPPRFPELPPDPDPDVWPGSPESPPAPAQLAPQLATQKGATYATSPMVRSYLERRHELVTVAPARRVGLVPSLMASEYRGVWLGVLIWLGLMVLMWMG